MIEIIILSIIQGITEFLPISSSAHLIIIENFFNFNNSNLNLDISLHAGSLLAVILFFNKDIFNFINNKIFLIKIIISSIPTIIFGFFLVKFNFIDYLRDVKVIAMSTIIFAIILYYSDKSDVKKNLEIFTLKDAIIIGLFQILSLIPGVSRSGITITAGRFLKFDRNSSIKISFFFSIPILLSITFYNITNLVESNNINFTFNNLFGFALSFIFSYLTLKYFFRYIKKFNFTIFVLYRILIGILILVYIGL